MNTKKIGISNEKGQLKDFYFDEVLARGLFYTHNSEKVVKNIDSFRIQVNKNSGENEITRKMSIIDPVAIITTSLDDNHQTQFLVGNDLRQEDIESTFDGLNLPIEKKMIIDAYNFLNRRN